MNQFIRAIKDLNFTAVDELIAQQPKWLKWAEDDGKNALHYLGGVVVGADHQKAQTSLDILKLLLTNGADINSIHRIADRCDIFPATPLWYAYTRGRNETLYKYLLENGADPENCMYAIAWYDDVEAAKLFKSYGAGVEGSTSTDSPFLAAFNWKRYKVARWFLENGAAVNFADDKGNTALYYAVKRKLKEEQVNMLLHFGADVNKENHEGISPKSLAEMNRQKKILAMFRK